jgi:hypothetical protein
MVKFRVYSSVGYGISTVVNADYFEIKGSVLFLQSKDLGPVAAFSDWVQVERVEEDE